MSFIKIGYFPKEVFRNKRQSILSFMEKFEFKNSIDFLSYWN